MNHLAASNTAFVNEKGSFCLFAALPESLVQILSFGWPRCKELKHGQEFCAPPEELWMQHWVQRAFYHYDLVESIPITMGLKAGRGGESY